MQEVRHCPECRRRLQLPAELSGQLVQCPACGARFTAREDDRPAPQHASPGAARFEDSAWQPPLRVEPPVQLPLEDRRVREEEEDRRRRRRKQLRAEALQALAGPGQALRIAGGAGLVFSAIILFVSCAGEMGERERPFMPFLGLHAISGVVPGMLGIVTGLLILLGANHMLRLESHASAVIAATVAILPCSLCWIVNCPIGIWALVVLNQPMIRDAFDAQATSYPDV